MRILALDIGMKRIGVASGTTTRKVATGIKTIHRTQKIEVDLNEIKMLIHEYEADIFLLGLPLTLKGIEGRAAKNIRTFGSLLIAQFGMDVIYWDERFSSVSAERVLIQADLTRQKRKGVIDQVAATIFLQNYLDSLEHQQ